MAFHWNSLAFGADSLLPGKQLLDNDRISILIEFLLLIQIASKLELLISSYWTSDSELLMKLENGNAVKVWPTNLVELIPT